MKSVSLALFGIGTLMLSVSLLGDVGESADRKPTLDEAFDYALTKPGCYFRRGGEMTAYEESLSKVFSDHPQESEQFVVKLLSKGSSRNGITNAELFFTHVLPGPSHLAARQEILNTYPDGDLETPFLSSMPTWEGNEYQRRVRAAIIQHPDSPAAAMLASTVVERGTASQRASLSEIRLSAPGAWQHADLVAKFFAQGDQSATRASVGQMEPTNAASPVVNPAKSGTAETSPIVTKGNPPGKPNFKIWAGALFVVVLLVGAGLRASRN